MQVPTQCWRADGAGRTVIDVAAHRPRRLPGHESSALLHLDPELTARALAALEPPHRCSATTVEVDDAVLAHWVDESVGVLRTALAARRYVDVPATGRLAERLRRGLAGRRLPSGWIHGDFWTGNVLVARDGTVTGLIDWAQAQEGQLGVIDVADWLITLRMRTAGGELGAQIRDRLRGDGRRDNQRRGRGGPPQG